MSALWIGILFGLVLPLVGGYLLSLVLDKMWP